MSESAEETLDSPGTEETPEVTPPEEEEPQKEPEADPGIIITDPPPADGPNPELLKILKDKDQDETPPAQQKRIPIKGGGFMIPFGPVLGSEIHIKQLQLEKSIQEIDRINSEIKATAFAQNNLKLQAENLAASRQVALENLEKVKTEFVDLTKKHGLPTSFTFDRNEDGSYLITIKGKG